MATRVLDVILFFPKLVMFQMLKWSVRKRARVRTQEILATSLRKFMATTREVDEQEVNSQVLGTRNGWHRLSEGLFTYTKTGGFILLSKDTSLAEMIHQVLDIELEDEL